MQSDIAVGRVPVPKEARSVLVFGGSFDPPHVAHVELPNLARAELGLDWLLYVPARQSPLKERSPGASDAQRVAMLRAALDGIPAVSVATLEIERSGGEPSFTIETLRELRDALGPDVSLRLLIGEDQARQFHRWRDAERVIDLAEPAVMLRPLGDTDQGSFGRAMAEHWSEKEARRWAGRVVALPSIPAAATDVRAALERAGPESPVLAGLVPGPVMDIIRNQGLYAPDGGQPSA